MACIVNVQSLFFEVFFDPVNCTWTKNGFDWLNSQAQFWTRWASYLESIAIVQLNNEAVVQL